MTTINLTNQRLITYVHQVEQFFKYDKDVNVVYSDTDNILDLYVNSAKKSFALNILMPKTVTSNKNIITINVISLYDEIKCKLSDIELYNEAFLNNPIHVDTRSVLYYPRNLIYILFRPEIIKFYDDDLKNYNGYHHMLYEDIARNIFVQKDNVFFCTNPE